MLNECLISESLKCYGCSRMLQEGSGLPSPGKCIPKDLIKFYLHSNMSLYIFGKARHKSLLGIAVG